MQQICKTCLKEHHWKQKQSLRGVLFKRCSANMLQVCKPLFRSTPLEAQAVPKGVPLKRSSANMLQVYKTSCLERHLSDAVPLELLF